MATHDICIRLSKQPEAIPQDGVMAAPVTPLLVAGIVNPFGPTLNAVVAAGHLEPRTKLPVVRMMLNRFRQDVEVVGELAVEQTWRPSAVIRTVFGLSFDSCPSLLLPSAYLEEDSSVAVHADFLRGFKDARAVWQRVRQYFGNPWNRVSQELKEAFEGVTTAPGGDRGQTPVDVLNEDEARPFAELLLSEQHMKAELHAFLYAWNGSIHHMAPGLSSMSLGAFRQVFTHVASSCRLPDLSGGLA